MQQQSALTCASRRFVVAGNWKMFKTRLEAEGFVATLAKCFHDQSVNEADWPEIILCPSFTLLTTLRQAVDQSNLPIRVFAQTMDSHPEGAYTGEVSAPMLKDIEMQGVLLGHSERRQYFAETDETVCQKLQAALAFALTPIVCVGETLTEREADQADNIIRQQLQAAFAGLQNKPEALLTQIMVAYEPVWAIGTGKVCEAAEASRVCGLIRQTLRDMPGPIATAADAIRILYGGSVKPDNFAELLSMPDIDGGLVGGASLDAQSFAQLIQLAATAVLSQKQKQKQAEEVSHV